VALDHLSSYLTVPAIEFERAFATASHRVGEAYEVGLEAFIAETRPELAKRIDGALTAIKTILSSKSGRGAPTSEYETFKTAIAAWETSVAEAVQLYRSAKSTSPAAAIIGHTGPAFPIIALDTETTGLEKTAKLLGISYSLDGITGTYCTSDFENVLSADKARRPAFFNAKFDLNVLERHGLSPPKTFEDVLLMAHLLDENRSNRLKDLAESALAFKAVRYEEVDRSSPEAFARYAEQDAILTHRLYQHFLPQMQKEGVLRLYRQIELPLVEIVRAMEKRGLAFDTQQAQRLARRIEEEMPALRTAISQATQRDLNPNSANQLATFLFQDLGLPCTVRTEKGHPSVKEDVLEALRDRHPSIPLILDFKRRQKLLSTYLKSIPNLVDVSSGRIHPDFIQTGTETGRISCKSPNIQNIPTIREIRSLFVAGEGKVLIDVDYSQIELRVLAHYSGDEALAAAFTRGEDVHLKTAMAIFGKASVSPEERSIAKIINFGIIYGMGAKALARTAEITESEAGQFISRYFSTYRGVRAFRDQVARDVRRSGRVVSLFGRVRRLPDIRSIDDWTRKKAERDALNSLIQGTASDLCKVAMIRLHRAGSPMCNMIAQVHDEILFEVPEDGAVQTAATIKSIMETPVEGFRIPLLVECKTGRTWAECK